MVGCVPIFTYLWFGKSKKSPLTNVGSDPTLYSRGPTGKAGLPVGLPRPKDATSKVVEETSGRALEAHGRMGQTPRIWNKWRIIGSFSKANPSTKSSLVKYDSIFG